MELVTLILHTLLSFIVILSVIVFIHEFGHYFIARLCGVRIETFSIGFGREIFGLTDGHGTRWKFSLVPLGGYVKMFGDASEASAPDAKKLEDMSAEEKAVSFHYKPLPKKAAIVSAGPVANFLLTIIIFTYTIFTYGLAVSDPIVGDIVPGTPAEEAGLESGDVVLSVDGKTVTQFNDIPLRIATNTGTPVTLEINRAGEKLSVTLTPQMIKDQDALGNEAERPMLGFRSKKLTRQEVGFFGAIWEATKRTYQISVMTFEYIGQIFTGERSAKELKGPLGIAKLSGQAAEQGISTVLWFMALLSANLGMINLFPIPPLDGGHLAFYAVEGARGRPMAEKFQEWSFRVGFGLLLLLMAFTVFNDVRQMI